MAARKKAMFAGVSFTGTDMGEYGIKVPVVTLRRILQSGHVKIVNTMQHDDTCKDESKGEVKPEVITQSLDQNGTPRVCSLKDGMIRYSQHRNESYQITEVKGVLVSVPDVGTPLSVKMMHWLSENYPNATGHDMLDCVTSLFGRVYNRHKDENKSLLEAQEIVEKIMERIKPKK